VFIDQLLSNLNYKILKQAKEGRIDNTLVNLANLAIKIKIDTRDFADKSTIVNLQLVNYFSKDLQSMPQKAEIEKIKQKAPVEEIKKEIAPESNVNTIEQLVAQKAGQLLPRLKGMMNTANIKVIGDVIHVTSPYKFNLAYMSKKEAKEIFLDAAKELYKKDMDIKFGLSDIGEEEIKKSLSSKKEEIDDKILQPKKPDKSVDNSGLVEEIF
jgi:hypothetical protein